MNKRTYHRWSNANLLTATLLLIVVFFAPWHWLQGVCIAVMVALLVMQLWIGAKWTADDH
jgi:energy-coupling factor transporter transmembrane protein EcfT